MAGRLRDSVIGHRHLPVPPDGTMAVGGRARSPTNARRSGVGHPAGSDAQKSRHAETTNL